MIPADEHTRWRGAPMRQCGNDDFGADGSYSPFFLYGELMARYMANEDKYADGDGFQEQLLLQLRPVLSIAFFS